MNKIHSLSQLWNLSEITPLQTQSSQLLFRTRYLDQPAILKIFSPSITSDEVRAAMSLQIYNGESSVHLFAFESAALLMEEAEGPDLLSMFSSTEESCTWLIISRVIKNLHRYSVRPPGFPDLHEHFQALRNAAHEIHSETDMSRVILRSFRRETILNATICLERLLASEKDQTLLHGDLHHSNILHSKRGWLSIDPKGLYGERTYDLCNFFYNPEKDHPYIANEKRILGMAKSFAQELDLEESRILSFAFTFGVLSALWKTEDHLDPRPRLQIAELLQGILGLRRPS